MADTAMDAIGILRGLLCGGAGLSANMKVINAESSGEIGGRRSMGRNDGLPGAWLMLLLLLLNN